MFAAKTCWFVWFRGKICLPCPCVRFKADLLKPDRLELNSGFIRFHPKFTQKGPLVAIPGTTSSFIDGQRLFLYNHNASQLDHRCFPISFTKLTAGWYLGCLFATWTHPLTSGYLGRCTRLNQRRSITCSCSFCQLPGESRTQWAIFLFGFQSYVSLTGGTKISKIAREDHDFHPVSWIMCFFPPKKKRVVFQKSKNPSKSSNISGRGPQPPRPPFKRPWCSNLNFRKSRAAPLCSRFSSASPKKMAAGSTGSEKPWTSPSPSSFYPGLWRGLFPCSLSWFFHHSNFTCGF